MDSLSLLKQELRHIITRLSSLKTEAYVPYNGESGFICKANRPWYKYRGGPDNLGNPNIMVHILFTEIVFHDKDRIFNSIYNMFMSNQVDSEFIKLYQLYKNSLYDITMFLKELDLEIDEYSDLITYEQVVNMIDYSYAHLSLLKIDTDFLYLTDNHKRQYQETFKFFEMLQYRKDPLIQIMSMGLLYAEYSINFKRLSEEILNNINIYQYRKVI